MLDILQYLDAILTVILFATLAGLSLAAASILVAPLLYSKQSVSTSQTKREVGQYLGASYLLIAFAIFLVGLCLTLLFDTVFEKYNGHLGVEIADTILTGLPLLLGILFLYGGAGFLIRAATGRTGRLLPEYLGQILDAPILWIAGLILPPVSQGRNKQADKNTKYAEQEIRELFLLSGQDSFEPLIATATKDVLAKLTVVTAPSVAVRTGVGTGTVSRLRMSKADAQKRLDEDTKRVGYVRGEIYKLKDGSWGIHWGGKYPL